MIKFKANQEIRDAAKTAGIPFYKLAELFGITEWSFSRKMRYELSDQDKRKVLEFIRELSGVANPTRIEISICRLKETAAYFRNMRKAGYDGEAMIYKRHEDSCLAAIEILKEYNEEDHKKAD